MAEKKNPQTEYAWTSINNSILIQPFYLPLAHEHLNSISSLSHRHYALKGKKSTDELRQSRTTQRRGPHRLHRLLMLLSWAESGRTSVWDSNDGGIWSAEQSIRLIDKSFSGLDTHLFRCITSWIWRHTRTHTQPFILWVTASLYS